MIKPEDLRIGDLVRVSRDCAFFEGTVCVVTQVYPKGSYEIREGSLVLRNADGTSDESCMVHCCCIEGIPLSSEILEKNGWIGTKRALFVTYTKIVYTRVIFTIIETIGEPHVFRVCCGRNNCLLRNVMYVHELQHLLFGLGINHEMEV